MSGKNINFDDKKIKTSEFYKNKKVTNIDDIDVNKILVSKKEPYGTKSSFKYFIGYNDNDVIGPSCVRLSQMTGDARKFDENATMSFIANNKELLKNYNKKWEKVEKLLKTESESKPVYGDDGKYIKTKISIKMPKEKTPCKFLSIIKLDSVIKTNKKYYPQTFLEECKYVQEKIKMENLITDDLEKSADSDSNNEIESDTENDESNE